LTRSLNVTACAGARVGCIASHNKDVMGAVMRFAQARLCGPAIGQMASEGALNTPQSYFDSVKEEYISAVAT